MPCRKSWEGKLREFILSNTESFAEVMKASDGQEPCSSGDSACIVSESQSV